MHSAPKCRAYKRALRDDSRATAQCSLASRRKLTLVDEMMYLEDFLELIEGLPHELKIKTDQIFELDSSIHKASKQVEEDVDVFFSNAKRMKPSDRQSNHERILGKYYKILDDSEGKASVVTKMQDSLDRYMKKLDQELEKFKCELEADSPGITEVLERKSLELDEPLKESQKENRYNNLYTRAPSTLANSVNDWRTSTSTIKKEDPDLNFLSNMSLSPPPPPVSYSLGIGSGNNVIAAAASQAIAATQQMRQGRKTAILSNSFDSLSHGVFPSELSMGNEIAHAAKAALAASALAQESSASNSSCASMSTSFTTKKQKKTHKLTNICSNLNSMLSRELSPCPSEDIHTDNIVDAIAENSEWSYDPNEPRYCICNQVSYGDMVACDNPKCPLEWFHYSCVGISAPPKGKWYCPQCSAVNRRQRK